MTLQDILDQLSHGELRTAYLGDQNDGPLDGDKVGKLITHLNMGLTALHTRFRLKERAHTLNLQPDTQSYSLDLPDLLRIEAVKDLKDDEYLLNVTNDPESLQTPNFRTLEVPSTLYDELDSPTLVVTYRAKHPKIGYDLRFEDPETVDVDLPHTHLEALILYMASRVLNPVGMTESFHEGNNYAAKYEAECQRLENFGFRVDQTEYNDQFSARGWV